MVKKEMEEEEFPLSIIIKIKTNAFGHSQVKG